MSVLVTWLVAQSIANKPFDRELGEMARGAGAADHGAGRRLRPPRRWRFNAAGERRRVAALGRADDMYFQVLGLRGEFLSGDRSIPVPLDPTPPPERCASATT